MKKPIIVFENFSFQYNAQKKPTLKNINLTFYEGEKVLIVGASGSGKSTLGHAINGLIPFYYEGQIKGSLKIKGKKTSTMSIFELSHHVGTVLQDSDGQFVGMSVAEDIAFKLENDCMAQKLMKKQVKTYASLVGLDSHLEKAPQDLSGGQKQKTALAGVMAGDVDILLFDEPLANLDPATGKAATLLIDKLKHETNKTVIIIEHRLEDVLYTKADRIIIIDEGEVVEDGKPYEVLSSHILSKKGIREPLYITALKYADCSINKEPELEHIDTLKTASYEEQLLSWYHQIEKCPPKQDAKTILTFENVCFGYKKNEQTLNDLSFKIQKGEMISIVGKNGAGKSTLAKLICGFYKPTKGKILLKGRDIGEDTIRERSETVGFVMQNPNQMISKNLIFDEVALGLRTRGVSETEITEKVEEALKICGLYPFRNWPVSALSFGQKKRVTIASILVLKPQIIILDEPTAGQDFKHYTEMMEFLKSLNQKGLTIIMITHDMHLMLEYTDRAIVMSEGSKIADDEVYRILTDPEIIKKANLKETSLYELALKLTLADPQDFVKSFIAYERRIKLK